MSLVTFLQFQKLVNTIFLYKIRVILKLLYQEVIITILRFQSINFNPTERNWKLLSFPVSSPPAQTTLRIFTLSHIHSLYFPAFYPEEIIIPGFSAPAYASTTSSSSSSSSAAHSSSSAFSSQVSSVSSLQASSSWKTVYLR